MDLAQEFIDFVNKCPTPYHFVDYASKALESAGYVEIYEKSESDIPQKGYVVRDGRAIIAFNIGGRESVCAVGSHCDSPCLKVVPGQTAGSSRDHGVSCALYGGGLWYTWFNRDLRLAGRVFTLEGKVISRRLFDSGRAIATIPGLKGIPEKGMSVDTDLKPILGAGTQNLVPYVAKVLEVPPEAIMGWELSFVDAEPATICGSRGELLVSPRLDDLASAFCALKAFLQSTPGKTISVMATFDHEEEGSLSEAGAKGNFLPTVLKRILGDDYEPVMARSIALSCDNAHAVNPAYSELHDGIHRPRMGDGPIIKKSPGSSYATDLTSCYVVRKSAEKLGLDLKFIQNRNDILGGSTIGPFLATAMGMAVVDMGPAQLGMHSARETMGARDIEGLTRLLADVYTNY
jgi:aspartyl aminopeptidase